MQLDFPLILFVLVVASGAIWLLDSLVLAARRQAAFEASTGQAGASAVAAVRAPEPVVVEYAKSFFPVLFVVFVLRSFLYEPFQIPSSSMVPTLEVGDYILVNKFHYGIRLPIVRSKVIELNRPKRGDVMVFFPPHMNDTYFIKRVIGIPGDRVSYRSKQLFVNGEPVPREWQGYEGNQGRGRVGEELLGEQSHLIQVDTGVLARDFAVVVQPGHYFMMGDNRDNSSDSRIWGQVPDRDIVGKAVAIWMHWDSFLSVPSFGRAGAIR